MPGGWVQPRVIGHWYTSLSAITNHKCHWLNIIYIYSQLYVYIYIYTIMIYYILYTCSKIHGSTSKNVTNSYRFCGSIAIPHTGSQPITQGDGSDIIRGISHITFTCFKGMQGNITLKYWGYNLQQILVLVMWTKSPKFGTFTKPWSWTVAQKVRTSAHLRYLSSRFWPTVSPATTLKADTDVGGFNPH